MYNTVSKLLKCGCCLVVSGLALSYIPYTAAQDESTLHKVSNTVAAVGVGAYCIGTIVSTFDEE